jgi:hypothetical protein
MAPAFREWVLRMGGMSTTVALAALGCGTDVFLELGLLQRAARDEDLTVVVYALDARRAVRRERVTAVSRHGRRRFER